MNNIHNLFKCHTKSSLLVFLIEKFKLFYENKKKNHSKNHYTTSKILLKIEKSVKCVPFYARFCPFFKLNKLELTNDFKHFIHVAGLLKREVECSSSHPHTQIYFLLNYNIKVIVLEIFFIF